MRLVKQSFLYFKEGKSDKVYEIDLCDTGNDTYVVNFRYGRRGSPLKEGSKTPVPVSLAEAERIYDTVQEEKINKGYTTSESGTPRIPAASAFTLETESPGIIITGWETMPAGIPKAILQRLQQALQGNNVSARFAWKLSRVIWKAGEYKIKEAAPYIIKLFNKGNAIHQYSCTWALARCGHDVSANALQSIYSGHPSPLIKKIAGAGLFPLLTGLERQQHTAHYLNRLPVPLKAAIEGRESTALDSLLRERIAQQQPGYDWLESIYLLSADQKWIRPFVKNILLAVPLRPNYFRHLRAIFKLAELLDDFEISGLLACRIEREEELFKHHVPALETEDEVYVEEIEDFVNPHKELRKKNSRLAYSQKTRWYLHRRIRRRMHLLGDTGNTDYVRLATAVLIAYNNKLDFKAAFSTREQQWTGRRYVSIETRFPENAHAVLLHEIVNGDHPDLLLLKTHIWRIKGESEPEPPVQRGKTSVFNTNNRDREIITGFFKKLLGFFIRQKVSPAPAMTVTPPRKGPAKPPSSNDNGTPYLHLWNLLPQSYLQLLLEAQMDEIHEFAISNLASHPAYADIREKTDKQACKRLLLSPFTIPAEFGYTIVREKYMQQAPEADLVMAMLNSINDNAREKGMQCTQEHASVFFQQADFIKDLVFARQPTIRAWAKGLIREARLSGDLLHTLIAKSIAEMMGSGEQTPEKEAVINSASNTLFELFPEQLADVNLSVIADLLQHPSPAVLLFGLQLLKIKKQHFNPEELSQSLLFGLLQHPYEPVREMGLSFLSGLSDTILLHYREAILTCCVSPWQNVRQGLPPVIARMAQKEKGFGMAAAGTLMPWLVRKETSSGLHEDIGRLLCNELSGFLQDANKETALRLLYGHYTAAQQVGVTILEKYTNPAQLTIAQVMALGGHENLAVRNWCWKFYTEQPARIKYEKENSIRLLENKWQDTRQFAMRYFRENFSGNDWSPETLVALADSVKPDVEAFGRELITKFFTGEQGLDYLLKLSQHPSEKMQLFATNYLERYAADDPDKIQSLEFYFRAVLTRVNKSRIAKNRIYLFLLSEGRKSESAAVKVAGVLSDISATAAIGDKARCIDILLQLGSIYEINTPLKVHPTETRV